MKMGYAVLLIVAMVFGFVACSGNGGSSDTISTQALAVGTSLTNVPISAFGTHFYNFVAAGNGTHTVRLTNLGSDMEWTLFTNPSYSNPGIIDSQDNFFDNSDEIGPTVSLTSGVTYYLAIDEWDSVASQYDLQVTFP